MVMLGHLRAMVFVDFSQVSNPGFLVKGFYFLTGLGHEAVVVFFVLSGYFVGGSVLAAVISGRFSWSSYGITRMSRLWVVLVPALVLTMGLDGLGKALVPHAYGGSFSGQFMSGPSPERPLASDAVTFLGNLCFLQTVRVPIYGTNSPLWSLANEFWYYVLFPLLVLFCKYCSGKKALPAVGCLVLFLAIGLMIPRAMLLYGLIWALGAGAWWVQRRWAGGLERARVPEARLCSDIDRDSCAASKYRWKQKVVLGGRVMMGLTLLLSLVGTKQGMGAWSDFAVAVSFAGWLCCSGDGRTSRLIELVAAGLANISYTLYVVHFPIMFFLFVTALKGRQFPQCAEGFLWFAIGVTVTMACAGFLWWVFERNTGLARRWMCAKLTGVRTGAGCDGQRY